MKRYITCGIKDQVPIDIQLFCWQCYERIKVTDRYDYLQVFELQKIGDHTQQIEHRQELPEYSQVYQLRATDPTDQKIFIVEEDEHVTMLLAEEY